MENIVHPSFGCFGCYLVLHHCVLLDLSEAESVGCFALHILFSCSFSCFPGFQNKTPSG